LLQSLELYKSQLEAVESALAQTVEGVARDDLLKLHNDLQQLQQLTQESLLSYKKSLLLRDLESSATGFAQSTEDQEFLAFQAAISGMEEDGPSTDKKLSTVPIPSSQITTDYAIAVQSCPSNTHSSHSDSSDSDGDQEKADSDILDEIAGTKCRVSYRRDWGPAEWHNAMVLCAEPIAVDEPPAVRILFCNPRDTAMRPCPYFLDGLCKFTTQDCRFSHGLHVPVEELEEFVEPDFSGLKLEAHCRAKFVQDGLWYRAVVVDVLEDHRFTVMFDKYENVEDVGIEDIIPLEEGEEEGSVDEDDGHSEGEEESNETSSRVEHSESEGEDAAPCFLWRPPKTTDALGDWEKHTRGKGSELMRKMGYITGQGLGKDGEGRAESVPIQLIPAGKSLDRIMELKELAGDMDLYNVTKKSDKSKRKQHKIDNKAAEAYVKPWTPNVFDIINKKLGGKKKGNVYALTKKATGKKNKRQHITESDLATRSDKHLNVQLFKTEEEMKNVDKEIVRLKHQLKRHIGKDRKMVTTYKGKISSMQKYKTQLRASAGSIQQHKTKRKDVKKLAVF